MKLTALVPAVLFSVACFAAVPTIGVVTSSANGEAPLTDGSSLKTETTASDVRLDTGVAVRLAPRSAGTLFADHAVLEEGAARVSHFEGYALQAGQLSLESETPETAAVIRVNKQTIEIASLGGDVKVSEAGMLTRVAAGSKMSFQNSAATPAQSGAAPGTIKKPRNETKIWLFVIGGIAAAALAIGLTAAAEGKSL